MTDHSSSPPASAGREEEIRARVDAATPGPWQRDRNWYVTAEGHDWSKIWLAPGVTLANYDARKDRRVCHIHGPSSCNEAHDAAADFEFIAHARADVPWLLDELAASRSESSRLREAVTAWVDTANNWRLASSVIPTDDAALLHLLKRLRAALSPQPKEGA